MLHAPANGRPLPGLVAFPGFSRMTTGVLAEARAATSAAVNATERPSRGIPRPRDKLTFRSELDYELLLLFAKNELSTSVATPLLAVIVAVGAMFWAPPEQ